MKNKSSIVFTGDIGFDRYMYGKWNDEELISPEILGFLHSADHVVANVEGPVAPVEQNTTKEEWAEHFAEPLRTGRVPGESSISLFFAPLQKERRKKNGKRASSMPSSNIFLSRCKKYKGERI